MAPVPHYTPPVQTIRLDIKVEPTEAVLTLDKHVAAGNRLQAEVPKDRSIHVVRASAPGFIPFNQIVTFSSDVHLDIELHRARPPVHGAAKPHPAQIESTPKIEFKTAPQPSPDEEPGMKLERPAAQRAAKHIDERDPYLP
ncbi:MAG TPA: hypothetical protein VF550_02320 [Polyangia bacterium]